MSEDQFLEAVMRMRDKLYRVAMALLWNEQDAADAVQEAMLKAWKHRGGLRDATLFEAWFMRVLVNQCRDQQRRQIRGKRLIQRLGGELAVRRADAPNTELFEAIHRLPDRLRLPVLLYYFDGYSQKETAGILGVTQEQVKTRVRQARERLKAYLQEEDGAVRAKGGGRDE